MMHGSIMVLRREYLGPHLRIGDFNILLNLKLNVHWKVSSQEEKLVLCYLVFTCAASVERFAEI
jgi:hypothetical protein